jgi:hypothetical protein
VEQIDLLRIAIEALDRLRIPYAIVGSFASGAWGESRFTQDIDILVDLKVSQVVSLCREFSNADCYVSESAAADAVAQKSQFNIIHPASGNKIDFMIASDTVWTRAQLQRRRRIEVLPDREADVAAPEDVILGKLVYYQEGGSEKHLRDIGGILKISGAILDWPYLDNLANQLGLTEIWQAVKNRASRP